MRSFVDTVLARLGASDRLGLALMRVAIAVIFLWVGALKFVPYEADSITPFVANNPVMSLFYKHPDQYRAHLTREGQLVPAERAWQTENNTSGFSTGLGVLELTIGTLVLLDPISVSLGFLGALLAFLTPFVTLSFLVTTPEAWVPALGDAEYSFPYLSGAGRLVLKDKAILAGGLLILADSARSLRRKLATRSRKAGAGGDGGSRMIPTIPRSEYPTRNPGPASQHLSGAYHE